MVRWNFRKFINIGKDEIRQWFKETERGDRESTQRVFIVW